MIRRDIAAKDKTWLLATIFGGVGTVRRNKCQIRVVGLCFVCFVSLEF